MSPDWRDRAACDGQPALFFPAEKETPGARTARVAAATAICGSCPVRADCLAYASRRGMRFGIFGGTDFGYARNRQRAARKAAAA